MMPCTIETLEDLKNIPNRGTDWEALRAMTDEEVERRALDDPDAQLMKPDELSRMRRIPDVKRIREGLGLTQQQFADRYMLSIGAVRDWEQRRRLPLGPAMGLLYAIAASPDVVARAIAAEDPAVYRTNSSS
jgi:putative transcriptional regulator